jgi:hypothetical protein
MTLVEWETRWKLNGDHLNCVACKAAQWPYNASQAFLHVLDCPAQRAAPEYPWRELARIIAPDQQA